jgi:hypothetical protein
MYTEPSAVTARLDDLELLTRLAGAGSGGASVVALPRYKFIAADSVQTTADGAIAFPYKSVGGFITGIGTSTTAAESSALMVGVVTPSLNGYTENVTFPAYRNIELRADFESVGLSTGGVITGNATWPNVAGTNHAPSGAAVLYIKNIPFSGSLTITDDGSVPGVVLLAATEPTASSLFSSVLATGATALSSFVLSGAAIGGACNLGTATTVASIVYGGQVTGLLTAKAVNAVGGSLSSVTIAAGNATATNFFQTTWSGVPVLTGGAGSFANFDGPSWRAFLSTGGTVTGGIVPLVIGGYSGGEVAGAALTNADVTVALNGVGATAGFTGGGNHYTISGGLTGGHIVTLGTGGAKVGDTILITRTDTTANTYTVKDDAATTLFVMPVSKSNFALCTFNGTHFVLTEMGVN